MNEAQCALAAAQALAAASPRRMVPVNHNLRVDHRKTVIGGGDSGQQVRR